MFLSLNGAKVHPYTQTQNLSDDNVVEYARCDNKKECAIVIEIWTLTVRTARIWIIKFSTLLTLSILSYDSWDCSQSNIKSSLFLLSYEVYQIIIGKYFPNVRALLHENMHFIILEKNIIIEIQKHEAYQS